jgi:Tfp pilus assembly protein PilF
MIKFKNKNLYYTIFFYLFFLSANSENIYLNDGIKLFDKKNYEESKIKFEKDIVFNPKSETSYLYLAKIFKEKKKKSLQENNLNTVLLLNPKNEEAVYLLALLNIEKSNFSKSKELIKNLNLLCNNFCNKIKELDNKLENSLK